MRRYRVEEVLTIVGVAEVEAASKADAREKVLRGEVELTWNDGQDVRRGDGVHVYVADA